MHMYALEIKRNMEDGRGFWKSNTRSFWECADDIQRSKCVDNSQIDVNAAVVKGERRGLSKVKNIHQNIKALI